eukprot:179973-Chlamydomonas_euryale.AAC.1
MIHPRPSAPILAALPARQAGQVGHPKRPARQAGQAGHPKRPARQAGQAGHPKQPARPAIPQTSSLQLAHRSRPLQGHTANLFTAVGT